jgi:hypothetical protein
LRSERVCLPRLEAGPLFLQGHAAPRPVVASAVLRAAATIGVIVGCGVRVVNLFGSSCVHVSESAQKLYYLQLPSADPHQALEVVPPFRALRVPEAGLVEAVVVKL